MPVADQFRGDRYGILEDRWGHSWSIATPGERQLGPEEVAENMRNMASA